MLRKRQRRRAGASAGADLQTEVLTDLAALERLAPEWEALTAETGQPAALPGWQLAWWRHFAPAGALLRVVAVRRDGRLIAVAPYEARPAPLGGASFQLLATEITQRVEPVVAPGLRQPAAAAIARALAAGRPAVGALQFEAADADDAWLDALGVGWPGRRRPWVLTDQRRPGPFADLRHDSYDDWLASRSSNFRQQARRFRRRLHAAGGTVRMTRSQEQLEHDVEAFVRLHHSRWDERGGSALARDIGPMLRDAGRALLPAERFRLWIVELDGRAVGAHLFLAAGQAVQYWNGGFDVEASQVRPALVGMVAAIEDCIERGDRTLDLGAGAHDYKLRIADGDRPLTWSAMVPRDVRYPLGRAALGRRELAQLARRGLAALPEPQQERVRSALRRRRG